MATPAGNAGGRRGEKTDRCPDIGHGAFFAIAPKPAKTTRTAAVSLATNSSRDSPRELDRYFAPWPTVCSVPAISSGVTPSRRRSFSAVAAAIVTASRASNAATAKVEEK